MWPAVITVNPLLNRHFILSLFQPQTFFFKFDDSLKAPFMITLTFTLTTQLNQLKTLAGEWKAIEADRASREERWTYDCGRRRSAARIRGAGRWFSWPVSWLRPTCGRLLAASSDWSTPAARSWPCRRGPVRCTCWCGSWHRHLQFAASESHFIHLTLTT